MLDFRTNDAATVAADAQAALASYDDAIGAAARLTISFLAATRGSGIPAGESQKVIQALHDSAGSAAAGRAGLVSAVSLLTSLQRRSNQAETDFGCPGPMPWDASADRKRLKVVAA